MIVTKKRRDGKYYHACDRCGEGRTNSYPTFRFSCKCLAQASSSAEIAKHPAYLAGDELKETLESYGLTVEWWQEFKKSHGYPPGCDCPERQAWLNEASNAHPHLAAVGIAFLKAIRRRKKR